jgi:UDP-N-acetylglucosamine/UDP-N-acetylgalactosamine diphosphorylase
VIGKLFKYAHIKSKLVVILENEIIRGLKNKKYAPLVTKAFGFKQGHVFRFWDKLNDNEKEGLLKQLEAVDFELMRKLVEENILKDKAEEKKELEPAKVIGIPGTEEEIEKEKSARKAGEESLRKGEIAVFVVAGGQGSRLGFEGPKGMYPVTAIKKKTLFRVHAEKIKALSLKFGVEIPFIIMTSETNDQETKEYFKEQDYFGLGKDNVITFKQDMMPAVDGKFVMKSKGELFMNPNGHGGSISGLYKSEVLEEMKKRGIRRVFYFQVDNPLIKIGDPVFVGYHLLNDAEMSAKVIRKAWAEEKVGVYCYINGKIGVVEYSDLSREDMFAKDDDGELVYSAGNIAVHIIEVDFIEEENREGLKLPYHVARKKMKSVDGEIEAIKFETFVFDAFADVKKYAIMEVKREEEYAVVKNAQGEASAESSKEICTEEYAKWLEAAGVEVPRKDGKVDGVVEISPLFALDKEEFVEKYDHDPDLKSGFELYIG